jgi:hypothetical protein
MAEVPRTPPTIVCQATVPDPGVATKSAPSLTLTDKGDGTIADSKTGLVWETKDACDDTGSANNLHDGDNYYPWAGTCSTGGGFCRTSAECRGGTCKAKDSQGTGMTIFMWVANLNAAHFAGQSDWRIPTIDELATTVDYASQDSRRQVASVFNSGRSSCTASSAYWSANASSNDSELASSIPAYPGATSRVASPNEEALRRLGLGEEGTLAHGEDAGNRARAVERMKLLPKTFNLAVRAVRGAQRPASRFFQAE